MPVRTGLNRFTALPGTLLRTHNKHKTKSFTYFSSGHFEFDRVEIFQNASSLKRYNLFFSNGVAIFSGFHQNPPNILVGFTDVINYVKVLGQLQGQGPNT